MQRSSENYNTNNRVIADGGARTMLKDRLSLIASKKRNGQAVAYKLIHKTRKVTIERPQYAAVHQLPNPKFENALGNFWIVQESTPGRYHMGRNESTIYYRDLESA